MNIEKLINEAVRIIENGGVVILPADTVYGIFGNALNEQTIDRVYQIKGRKRGKPFGIVSSKTKVSGIVQMNAASTIVVNSCWPAAISLIAPKRTDVIPAFFSGDEPGLLVVNAQNQVLSKIVEKCSVPIFSTTCNLAGETEAKTIEDLEPFRTKVDMVLENHYFDFKGRPSTIVNTMGEAPVLIREGAHSAVELGTQVKNLVINTSLLIQ